MRSVKKVSSDRSSYSSTTKTTQNEFTSFQSNLKIPHIIKKFPKLNASSVYDTYWKFAVERQNIFYARLNGNKWPWTKDKTLQSYKFTNAYRASDRVSQFLIRNVIYGKNAPTRDVDIFLRIILFKLFNKIETWEYLEQRFGTICYDSFSIEEFDRLLKKAKIDNGSIYSAAYIMPSGRHSFGYNQKHKNHLLLLDKMIKDRAPEKISEMPTMEGVYQYLLSFPTIGNFLAYQFTIDLNYSELTNFGEMDFVVAGPGAIDGITKCFGASMGYSNSDIIRFVADCQEYEFERLGLNFTNLFGRQLQLVDCQNIFCEVDKYARIAHPEIKGVTGRNRIKQKYAKSKYSKLNYFYPPKWKINEYITTQSQ